MEGAPLQTVSNNASAVAAQLKPLARLDPSQNLHLAISLPLHNQTALTALLMQLSDRKSANYRKYLTPAQFTERFGPTQQDYDAVIAFASAHSLMVTKKHSNRLIVDVEGKVSDIEKALHVTIRTYQHPKEPRQFYAPDAAPRLDLATPILGISGLDNLELPQPRVKVNPAKPVVRSVVQSETQTMPEIGSGPAGGYMGNDFRNAYVPATTLTGTGEGVALVEFDGYLPSDISYYENIAGLSSPYLDNITVDGFDGLPATATGETEVSLDIEMVLAMAPGIPVILVYEAGPSGNWHDILNQIATDDYAAQISCSWFIPNGPADPVADAIFQEMAAQGQSFFAASGDDDAYTGLIPFPDDDPYITQVGGTMLTTSTIGGAYAGETVWNWNDGNGSGGGISTQYSIPTWQQGISMAANGGSTTMRNVPDVAMVADNVYVRSCGQDENVGGTSCAAPLWAALTALANEQASMNGLPPVGFINPVIYAAANQPGYAVDFNDITVGNNFSIASPGLFSAVAGYDLCTGLGTPGGSALVNTLAGNPDPLQISGVAFNAVGYSGTAPVRRGHPIAYEYAAVNQGSNNYTLVNTSGTTIAWSASSNSGIALSNGGGTLGPGASTTVTVTAAFPNESTSPPWYYQYSYSLTFTDVTTGVSQSIPISLTVDLAAPIMSVTPLASFGASGQPGGPWALSSGTYMVTNSGYGSMNWAVSNTSNWLTFSPSSGTLASGSSAMVAAIVTSAAGSLPAGSYGDSITFTNVTGNTSNLPLNATLNVGMPPVITSATFVTTLQDNEFQYWITATNNPTSFQALDLPAYMRTGIISMMCPGKPARP